MVKMSNSGIPIFFQKCQNMETGVSFQKLTSLVKSGNGGELPNSSRAGKKFRAAWKNMAEMVGYGKDGRIW